MGFRLSGQGRNNSSLKSRYKKLLNPVEISGNDTAAILGGIVTKLFKLKNPRTPLSDFYEEHLQNSFK